MKKVCLTAADPLKSWVGVSREEIRRNSVFVLFCFVLFGGIVFVFPPLTIITIAQINVLSFKVPKLWRNCETAGK